MNYQTPKIVIPSRRRTSYQLLALVITLIAFAAGGYLYSWNSVQSAEQELMSVVNAQENRIQELQRKLTDASGQMAVLERAGQIDREAMDNIKQQLATFQEERTRQEEELTFLRSLVASKDDREGIQVRRFALAKGDREGEFNYRFTVSQTVSNGEEASGWIFIGIDGLRKGEPAWLPLREITDEKTERLKMRFKHFQDMQGSIKVPGDFEPLKFIIEIKPNNKKISEVRQRFDWKT
ncbi:MAG: hypothetical protein KDI63_04775 [Gammaproteobacteria bacterium]|nr:hypothetical protein [Gammaproteobacteria bacterium]